MINDNQNSQELYNYEYYPDIYTLLYNNLACLTQMHYNNQYVMLEEINKLKTQKETLENK